MQYIVQCGLTRRLVTADTPEDAANEFLNDKPIRRSVSGLWDAMDIHEATEDEVAEFKRRRPKFDGQVALDLDDARLERRPRAQAKEHA